MDMEAEIGGGGGEEVSEESAGGIGEADVGDDTVAEESVFGGLVGAIEELVWQDDMAGFVLWLEGADGGDGKKPADIERAEGVNIGAVIEFVGEDTMTSGVASEEVDLAVVEASAEDGIGGWAKGCFDEVFGEVG